MKKTVEGMFNNKGELTVDLDKLGLEQYKKYKIIIKEINPMLTLIKGILAIVVLVSVLYVVSIVFNYTPAIKVSDQDIRIDEMFNSANTIEFRQTMIFLIASHAKSQDQCTYGLMLAVTNGRVDIAKKECQ
jgi:hypothetical protein